MTINQMLAVFTMYDEHLYREHMVDPRPMNEAAMSNSGGIIDQGVLRSHLRWMCQQQEWALSQPYVSQKALMKANRWLGYVQGELRALGEFSIDQMRAHNRTAQDAQEV